MREGLGWFRAGGIIGEILVVGPSPVSIAEETAELGITIVVADGQWLQVVLDRKKSLKNRVKIHVKIDSGMVRIGLRYEQALRHLLATVEQSEDVIINGAFTHFSCADRVYSLETEKQFEKFMDLVRLLPENPSLIHASNSAATLLYPKYGLDAVCFGIILYGVAPFEVVQDHLPFKLESELAFVKLVEKNADCRYNLYGSMYGKVSGKICNRGESSADWATR